MTNLSQNDPLSFINAQLSQLTISEQISDKSKDNNGFSVKITVPRNLVLFNLEEFVNDLSVQNRLKMIEVFQDEMSETQAVLALIESLSEKRVVQKNSEEKQEKQPVIKIIDSIIKATMSYNRQVYDGDLKKIVIPSYGIVNKVSEVKFGKQIAPTTSRAYFEEHYSSLTKELAEMGISEGMEDKEHNGRYHRTTMGKIIRAIAECVD